MCLLFFPVLPSPPVIQPIAPLMMIATLLAMVAWVIFGKLEYTAKKVAEASIFLVIIKFSPIVTLLCSLVFFGEHMTVFKLFAVALTMVANLLISVDQSFRIKLDRGFWLSFATALILGIAWAFDKGVAANYNLPLYSFFAFAIPGLSNLLLPKVAWSDVQAELRNTKFAQLFVLSLVNAGGYMLMVKALLAGEASRVVLVISSAAIITVVLAIFLLREKERVLQKLIAAALVTIATVMLAM